MVEMESRETILNELKATSTILDKVISLPYIVPKIYFTNLALNIEMVVGNIEIIKEEGIPNFSVPEGYFDNLSTNVLSLINREEVNAELSLIAPTLKTIPTNIPYQVAEGYFNDFRVYNHQSANNASKAKVVSINKGRWFQIAVAASVVGIIAVSGYFIFDKQETVTNNYASYKSVDVQGSVKKVSDDDLEKYLNSNDYLTSNTDVIIGDENEDLNPKQEIKSVSDNELKQYLKEAGNSKKTVKKGI